MYRGARYDLMDIRPDSAAEARRLALGLSHATWRSGLPPVGIRPIGRRGGNNVHTGEAGSLHLDSETIVLTMSRESPGQLRGS